MWKPKSILNWQRFDCPSVPPLLPCSYIRELPTCHFVRKPFLHTSQCSGYSELWILRWSLNVRSSLKLLSHWLQWKLFSWPCTWEKDLFKAHNCFPPLCHEVFIDMLSPKKRSLRDKFDDNGKIYRACIYRQPPCVLLELKSNRLTSSWCLVSVAWSWKDLLQSRQASWWFFTWLLNASTWRNVFGQSSHEKRSWVGELLPAHFYFILSLWKTNQWSEEKNGCGDQNADIWQGGVFWPLMHHGVDGVKDHVMNKAGGS